MSKNLKLNIIKLQFSSGLSKLQVTYRKKKKIKNKI